LPQEGVEWQPHEMAEPPAHLLEPVVLAVERYIQSWARGKAVRWAEDFEEHLQEELQGSMMTEVFGASDVIIEEQPHLFDGAGCWEVIIEEHPHCPLPE